MKVNSFDKNNTKNISFDSFYNSKSLKNILSFAEKNGAVFAAATSLTLSATTRPAAILATPNTDKQNKKIACAKAITSTILDFILTFAISLPIIKAVGVINKNPKKYLKSQTIQKFQKDLNNISDSDAYNFGSQIFKLGVGIIIALPKAILNAVGTPYISKIFEINQNKNTENNGELSFKGKDKNKLSMFIAKFLNNTKIQDFSEKHHKSNFAMHISAIKDALTTGTFITAISKNKKIQEERKGPLIYNSLTATVLSIFAAYTIDSLTDKPAQKFIKKFSEANKNDPNLKKYLHGFKNAKPIIIMGTIYYTIIPFISTFFADRLQAKYPLKNKTN